MTSHRTLRAAALLSALLGLSLSSTNAPAADPSPRSSAPSGATGTC
jgi:hypothetical protein